MTLAYVELLDLIWVVPVAVIIVATSYSVALLGATRSSEHRRAGNGGVATAWGVLGLLAAFTFTGVVVAGIGVIVAG